MEKTIMGMESRKKILLVDDDRDILEALQLTFEEAGYETKAETQAEQTCQLVEQFKPDAIVLDVLLSGKDGRVICKELKTSKKTKHVPIIMISAQSDARWSIIQAGADNFLEKPFDIYELLKRIEKLSV